MAIGLNNDSNNLGILNGIIGTDYRNLIKRTTNVLTRVASPTSNSSTTSTSHVSSGVGFSYASTNINSRLIITFQLPTETSYTAQTGQVFSYVRTYVDTSSVPVLGTALPLGTSTQINSNENVLSSAYFTSGTGLWIGNFFLNHRVEYNPNTLNILYYYLSFRTTGSANVTFYVSNSSQYPTYTVEEYL